MDSFNEAEASLPRKYRTGRSEPQRASRRFNEAEASLPRKCGGRNRCGIDYSRLQ